MRLELVGRQAVVVGLARSGVAAARLLLRRGAHVLACDLKPASALGDEVKALAQVGLELALGGPPPLERLLAAQYVVVSPGVPWESPELSAARRAGVRVLAEIELAAELARAPLAAVTGTKGKSTTSAALGAMLAAAGHDARVSGNIGRPFSGQLDDERPATCHVVEVSSFQLEGCERFHPRLALFLNLSPDHLDRHPDFAAYAAAKARVFRNQGAQDWALINGDDPQVVALAAQVRARRVPFHERPPAGGGDAAYFEDGRAWLRLGDAREELFERRALRLPGAHLALDLLAAAAGARLWGAAPAAIARAAADFRGLEHVLEAVGERHGVRFFNDTKATNVDAVRRSLEAFDGPLAVIMGGRPKGGDFAALSGPLRERARLVLAIGEARPLLATALAGVVPLQTCESLEQAVRAGYDALRAAGGGTLLLAPGCASFDMFRDYAERGRAFKAAVAALELVHPAAGGAH